VAAEVIEPEVKNFLQVMIAAVKRMALLAVPKYRPVTYVLQVHGNPNLEFVARSRDADAVIKAFAERDAPNLRGHVDSLNKQFQPEMIQFRLLENGNWAFSYLVTKNGKVIGSRMALDHRAVVLQDMASKRSRKKKDV
jgi:hypothetical protein